MGGSIPSNRVELLLACAAGDGINKASKDIASADFCGICAHVSLSNISAGSVACAAACSGATGPRSTFDPDAVGLW